MQLFSVTMRARATNKSGSVRLVLETDDLEIVEDLDDLAMGDGKRFIAGQRVFVDFETGQALKRRPVALNIDHIVLIEPFQVYPREAS